jgi:hypothetical protein
MKEAFYRMDDIDRHGAGCDCGDCDMNGKSYGASVYDVNDPHGDCLYRIYRADESTACEIVCELAENEGWEIDEEFED